MYKIKLGVSNSGSIGERSGMPPFLFAASEGVLNTSSGQGYYSFVALPLVY